MPTYDYQCLDCNCEFEEFHSMSAEPDGCQKCQSEGKSGKNLKKLINTEAKGIVELYGSDRLAAIQSDARRIEKEAHRNENTYANLIGESKVGSFIKK